MANSKRTNKFKKFIHYFFLFILAVVIAKYVILYFFPTSATNTLNIHKKKIEEVKKVKLVVDYKELQPKIEREYNLAFKDIRNYIQESLYKQKKLAYYNLSREDGFLDWIFGWIEGYKILWHKIKGIFGSQDNEVKLVTDKFNNMVIKPNLNNTLKDIQNDTKQRINDYVQSIMIITTEYLNKKIEPMKEKGYKIEILNSSIPFSKYGVALANDGFFILEATGVTGVSVALSKTLEAKLASLLSAKTFAIIEAKTASIVAAKIAAAFELLLAPVIDYFANEAVKAAKYNETKKEFQKIIDSVFLDMQTQLIQSAKNSLTTAQNIIVTELNKKTIIKGEK